jgi:hypothetical protein
MIVPSLIEIGFGDSSNLLLVVSTKAAVSSTA